MNPPSPIAAVLTALAAALLVAACSSSPSATGSGGTPNAGGPPSAGGPAGARSALAFSQCVRSHGVPDFPDPPPSFQGKFPGSSPQQLGVSQSRIRVAVAACQHLLPAVPGQAPLTAQDQQDYLRAAACMRAHGITVFPDPVFSGGGVSFPSPPSGVDTSSPRFTRARQICQRLIPAGLPYSGSQSGG